MRKRAFLLAAGAVFLVSASATPHFSVLDASCSENGPCTVKWTKSVKASSYSYLSFSSADLTAKRDVDYRAVSTSMTVGNNTLSGIVAAAVIPRPGYQGNRTFRLHMVATRYGIVDRADAVVTIVESEAAPPPPPAVTWTWCADEGGKCNVTGTARVRYGYGSTWSSQIFTVTGSVECSNSWFGDPLVGTPKICQTDGTPGAAPAPTPNPVPTPTPAPTPNPVPTGWGAAPLRAGGFARVTAAKDDTWDVTGPGNGRKLAVGEIVALYTNGWGENYDGRITYAIHALSDGGDGRAWEGSLEGVAPAGTPPALPPDWYAGSLATANKACAGAWAGTTGVAAGIQYRVTMTVGSWAKIPAGQPGSAGATWYAVPAANPYLGALSVVTGDCLTGS